ncbi:hypothetical protein K1T71_007524 [Dendrolimus kikuchii]|uniref:Uncharacterized protein n=1 Tax=Dendrolimus kikuchii TaxID=765133 RepID=A0ACC1D1A4_9NEOP|nr:hypothetical protein K1T71_007524 [Dendrolimus kikuchii]
MGRKIPAKKHRGVKDPLEQQAKRLQVLKTKINAPPKDPDEQPVPRSLTQLFAFQNNGKKHTEKKKIKRLQHENLKHKTNGVSENPIARLRKIPGETGREFSLRINSAVRALHNPLEQTDYPEELDKEDVKGEQMAAHRERRAKKRRKAKNGGKGESQGEHLTRTQKLALKKKEKKIKALEASEERCEVQFERVAFGEVSHAPPALHFKRRGADPKAADAAPRPGRRDLLLTTLLAGAGAPLPPAEVARRERARLDAVAAYRALKADNRSKKKL